MIKKALIALISLGVVLLGLGYSMYLANRPPSVPPVSAAEIGNPSKPYVVKLHAQWCAVCMITKGVWSQIEETYAQRVNLVVFDFTNATNAEAGRNEAARLGLEQFFEEYAGATGIVVVLDGRTKQVTAAIKGSRDFGVYRAAIEAALSGTKTASE